MRCCILLGCTSFPRLSFGQYVPHALHAKSASRPAYNTRSVFDKANSQCLSSKQAIYLQAAEGTQPSAPRKRDRPESHHSAENYATGTGNVRRRLDDPELSQSPSSQPLTWPQRATAADRRYRIEDHEGPAAQVELPADLT